jgi:NADH-quinone oxidoreductase subunit L
MPDSERILEIVPSILLLLPLFGFVVLALFGDAIKRDREQRGATILACVVVLASFGLAVWTASVFFDYAGTQAESLPLLDVEKREGPKIDRYFFKQPTLAGGEAFIEVGALYVPFGLLIDHLSLLLVLVITGIGSLIHIYSLGYMSHDEERVRYFSYLNLFTFFMLLLVMGSSLPLVFIGWEGVGLCSYLLIGFWFKKKSATNAGNKAFIVNRIGDAGLILAMALTFTAFGTLDLVSLVNGVQNLPPGAYEATLTAIGLLLFLGACGKSAQIPLHVWLPDAMEGPTPVSALIHAATMVTAGVYMVCRLSPIYMRAETAMMVVAIVGTATALMAARNM